MKNLSVTPRICFQLLRLAAIGLILVSLAPAQSADPVHIVPRETPNTPRAEVETLAVDRVPSLHPKPMHVQVDLVLVPVTVNDSMNHPVTRLQKEDFALFEGDKRQQISYFGAEEAPLSVAILFDVSRSMADKIDTERAALGEFVNNANPQDEYFAIAFSDRPHVIASSARSIDEIERQLISIQPSGSTAMLDAVYLAMSKLRNARYTRKAIVIFSDGGDNASRYTLHEIKDLVQESDVQIYAIGVFERFFLGPLEEKLGKAWLSEITNATGGRTITVDNRAKVPETAARISRELRNEYILGYRPQTKAASRWRKIRVRVTSRSASLQPLRAYYRTGYLAADR